MSEVEGEWASYLRTTAFLSPHTIKSYKNSHKKITNELGSAIRDAKPADAIEVVRGLTDNPSSQATLYTAVMVFRKLADLDNEKILKEKKHYFQHKKQCGKLRLLVKKNIYQQQTC